MKLSFPSTRLLILLFAILYFYGCVKTNPDTSQSGNNGTTTVTPVGTPIGDPVSITIGANGGSITSSDSKAELIFPAGALTENTSITIQAITNNALNGVGNAYRFLPEGIKFSQPVTVKFHYTADDLASTLADLMGIAFQDSSGGWWRINNFTNDTVNKIISAPISHFSIWTAFDMLLISPNSAVVSVNKSTNLEVISLESGDDELAPLDGNIDAEAPIVRSSNTKPITWAANGVNNGNSISGTIAGSSFYAAGYQAPSKVPPGSQNPVNISATIDATFKYHNETFSKPSLISRLRIVDKQEYLLEMKILDTVVNYDPIIMVVWDTVSMKVTIKGDSVTISEITNFPSTAIPTQLIFTHEAWYFIPDPIGEINITSAEGKVGPSMNVATPNDRLLGLTFTQTGTHDPKLRYTADNGYQDYSGGAENPGYPLGYAFDLDPDGEPTNDPSPLDGILDKVMEIKLTLLKN